MALFIFARFHAREGCEAELAALLAAQVAIARGEPGCLQIGAYRSTRDPRLCWIHSRWADEAAFEVHAALAQTDTFLGRVEPLIDHPFDITRTVALA